MPTTTAPQLAPVVTLLERAERQCTARGNQAGHPLDEQAIWHVDAANIWMATENLRSAVDYQLPRSSRFDPADPSEQPDGEEPLQLLEAAWTQLLELPDDLENGALLLGLLLTSDALAGLRSHYA